MQSPDLRIIFIGCWVWIDASWPDLCVLLICFFLGYRVITTPLPSGGPVLISMLNILDGFKFSKEDQNKSLTYHYMIEVRTCGWLLFARDTTLLTH